MPRFPLMTALACWLLMAPPIVRADGASDGAKDSGKPDAKTAKRPAKPAGKAKAERQVNAAALFDRFDKDQNGVVSPQELPESVRGSFATLDADRDGKIDAKEFEAGVKQLGAERFGAARGAEAPDPVALFRRLDTNGDGKLSKDEAPERIQAAFARIDRDSNGFLSQAELTSAMREFMGAGPGGRAAPRSAKQIFNQLDRDADGRLTRAETKGSALEQEFDALDGNHDGKLDPLEVENGYQPAEDTPAAKAARKS